MNELLQNFVESLREELRQCGELLALMEGQPGPAGGCHAEEVLAMTTALDAQANAIQAARRERAQRQREVAQGLGALPDAAIGPLIRSLPQAYRPLVVALVQENSLLLRRIRQRARQNMALLSRSLEMMDELINMFCDEDVMDKNRTRQPVAGPPRTHDLSS